MVPIRARSACCQGKRQRWFFQGICSKCGVRGQKADRCCQKGKGKGEGGWETESGSKRKGLSKGNWSNSRHTWDDSWHHSNWHGKTYGLEVDPWTAIEPVPYLRAVSLNPRCEDFSEPKRMARRVYTKTSQSGSPKDFAHLNEFSIPAPDDNYSLVNVVLQNTCRGFSVNNGDTVMNELMNFLQLLRQNLPVKEDPVHRSCALIMSRTFRRQVETANEFIT